MTGATTSADNPFNDNEAEDFELELAHEPSETLEELRKMAKKVTVTERPPRLNLQDIHEYPEVFQPRPLNVQHIDELKRAIKSRGEVEPITVMQIGLKAVVIDGHHRRTAYGDAGKREGIPVRYFEGSLEEAVLEAGKANSKAKLQMDNRTRQNYAWRLVMMDFSKRQIVEAASVSDGQIGIMRRVRKELGPLAFDQKYWWQAHNAWKGLENHTESDEELEERLEAQAANYADRLKKEFGSKLNRNTDLAARALARHFGRSLGQLITDLQGHWDGPIEAGDDDDF